jgi:hypothetical protein
MPACELKSIIYKGHIRLEVPQLMEDIDYCSEIKSLICNHNLVC